MGALFSTQDNWMINQTQRIAKGTGNFLRKTSEQLIKSEVSQAVRSGAIGRGLDSIGESIRKGAKKTANTASKVAQKGRNMFRKNNTKGIKNTSQKLIPANAKNYAVASNKTKSNVSNSIVSAKNAANQAIANNNIVSARANLNNKTKSNVSNPIVSAKNAVTHANANNNIASARANANNKSKSNVSNPIVSAKNAVTHANANNNIASARANANNKPKSNVSNPIVSAKNAVTYNNNSRSNANTVAGQSNQSNLNEKLYNFTPLKI